MENLKKNKKIKKNVLDKKNKKLESVSNDTPKKKPTKFVVRVSLRGEAMDLLEKLKIQTEMPADILIWHALKQFEIFIEK